jgi:tetratricopeptide (TPR) repeat protein
VHKNPWFMLILGAMVGLVLGYVFAERQPVPPAAAGRGTAASGAGGGLPEGHPPIDSSAVVSEEDQRMAAQAAELEAALQRTPDDPRLMVALGNLYFDASRWTEARLWYERALELERGDPNVLTDLAVVYRNLQQPERSLELLTAARTAAPEHWQAWYNTVVVLHFDLHRHDEAEQAMSQLEKLAEANSEIPDLSSLKAAVLGG